MSKFLFVLFFLLTTPSFAGNTSSSDTHSKTHSKTKASAEKITKSILNGTAEPQYKTISKIQYFAGGILGIFPGYGLGHAIQGRWMETGWIFTSTELLIKIGNMLVSNDTSNNLIDYVDVVVYDSRMSDAKNLALAISGWAWRGFRLWEIVDVWWLPSHYKLAQKKSFQIAPVYSYNGNIKGTMGLSFKYRW